jgi:hypothetical protein
MARAIGLFFEAKQKEPTPIQGRPFRDIWRVTAHHFSTVTE